MVSSSESWKGYRVHISLVLASVLCFALHFSYSLSVKLLPLTRWQWGGGYVNLHKNADRHCIRVSDS